MINFLIRSKQQPSSSWHIFNSLSNLDKIQRQLNVGLKVLSMVGMVFSAMTGFYSFQFIASSVNSVEHSLAIGAFLTSVVSFARLANYSYIHSFYEKV